MPFERTPIPVARRAHVKEDERRHHGDREDPARQSPGSRKMSGSGADEPNLEDVRPQRRGTVRRRLAALQEYEALPRRNWRDLTRLAEQVGLAPGSFHALWRSWRRTCDLAALQGGASANHGGRPSPDDEAFVNDALSRIAPGGSTESEVLEVERLAAAADVHVRSRSALRRLVRSIRESQAAIAEDVPAGAVAVDFTVIELPVRLDDGETLPVATVVLHPATRTVLAARLSLEPAGDDDVIEVLRRFLAGLATEDGRDVLTSVSLPPIAEALASDVALALARRRVATMVRPRTGIWHGGAIARHYGRELLGLATRPRMVRRPAAERRPLLRSRRINAPLTLAEAQRVIDERIARQPHPILVLNDAPTAADDLPDAGVPA